MKETILIVDDEQEIADLLEVYLKNEGYQVFKFYSGEDALSCVKEQKISLAILDVMLPDIDGFSLCKKIRESHYFPIIMLTAKVEEIDKITGFTMGADDYITKPFQPIEVVTRVKSQIRRYLQYNQAEQKKKILDEIDVKALHISNKNHKCTLNGKEIALTPTEFDILWYLASRKGEVVSSEELFEMVWGEKFFRYNNTVMAHIARLREKLKEPARKPKIIKTVWGVGYTIE